MFIGKHMPVSGEVLQMQKRNIELTFGQVAPGQSETAIKDLVSRIFSGKSTSRKSPAVQRLENRLKKINGGKF